MNKGNKITDRYLAGRVIGKLDINPKMRKYSYRIEQDVKLKRGLKGADAQKLESRQANSVGQFRDYVLQIALAVLNQKMRLDSDKNQKFLDRLKSLVEQESFVKNNQEKYVLISDTPVWRKVITEALTSDNIFYFRTEKLAKEQGLTLAKLEKKLNIANGTITRWKNGQASQKNIVKIADFFNVTTDYLLGRNAARQSIQLNEPEKDLLSNFRRLTKDKSTSQKEHYVKAITGITDIIQRLLKE